MIVVPIWSSTSDPSFGSSKDVNTNIVVRSLVRGFFEEGRRSMTESDISTQSGKFFEGLK